MSERIQIERLKRVVGRTRMNNNIDVKKGRVCQIVKSEKAIKVSQPVQVKSLILHLISPLPTLLLSLSFKPSFVQSDRD